MRAAFRRVLLAALLLFGLTAGATVPATAHDLLVSSDPRDGQTIPASQRAFTLTYSDKIQTFGAEVILEDAKGKRRTLTPQISRDQLRLTLDEDLPLGEGTLRWRVVSSDGHPIEGIIAFTVADPGASTTATPTASSPASQPKTTAVPYQEQPGVNWPLLIVGITAVACGIAGGILGMRMRKKD
ncbi:copper resistance protein CopC [Falsarthrobacter nasiphocae]|uniref:Methionine-rich copper-binding protein CopC n=1 Tax=Falsarthrobacter nasiphocae TaxID=189863 RepID=A0AAE3YIA0_9MICC|nr:copper resistance protein CopC [Falsarthrobacter nasiphocae]MDR6892261.1 methionine-rich copper-binding protein CopC [Falsarthrobacter nasiphocae]